MSKVFIKDKRTNNVRHFMDLESGDAFIYNNDLYIKSVTRSNDSHYAFHIVSGTNVFLNKSTNVAPVALDIHIYESVDEMKQSLSGE